MDTEITNHIEKYQMRLEVTEEVFGSIGINKENMEKIIYTNRVTDPYGVNKTSQKIKERNFRYNLIPFTAEVIPTYIRQGK